MTDLAQMIDATLPKLSKRRPHKSVCRGIGFALSLRVTLFRKNPESTNGHIAGVGTYIGQYSHHSRPWTHYTKNVQDLLNGLPYHNLGDDFRIIHKKLAEAYKEGRVITLTFLANVDDKKKRNDLERQLIKQCGSLNKPPFNRKLSRETDGRNG